MKAPILSATQWDKIEQHIASMRRPQHYRFLLQLMRRYGLRPMELAGLECSWFRADLTLRIPIGHAKRGSGRTISIEADDLEALAVHMGDRRGRVFVNEQGEPFNGHQMSASVRRMMGMSGVRGSTYSARRQLATDMVDSNISLAIVQQVLGHRHLSTTASYISVTDNMMRDALRRVRAA